MRSLPRLASLVAATALWLGAPSRALAAPLDTEKAVGVLALALLLVVAIPSLATVELLIMALLPRPVSLARDVLLRRRLACLVAGASVVVLGLFLVAVLNQIKGIGELLSVLIIAALVLGIVLGFPAIGLLAGRAVLEMSGRTPSTLASTAWGLVLILFGSLFPVLGWALFLFLCLAALGAVALALPEMRRPSALELAAAEEMPEPVDTAEPGEDVG